MSAVSSPIRILVVDDHPVVRQGIAVLLGSQSDMTLVQGRSHLWSVNSQQEDGQSVLPERLNSFDPTATVFQFENCQWRPLAENSDLEIDEFLDFSLDVGGWGCHHTGLLKGV